MAAIGWSDRRLFGASAIRLPCSPASRLVRHVRRRPSGPEGRSAKHCAAILRSISCNDLEHGRLSFAFVGGRSLAARLSAPLVVYNEPEADSNGVLQGG